MKPARAIDGYVIGLGIAGVAPFVATRVIVGPVFARMLADLGGPLPMLTQLLLTAWFPGLLAVLPASMFVLSLALDRRGDVRRARAFAIAAATVGLALVGLFLVGMYLPIFAIADAIQAD